jgi:hypothetical protein
MTGNDEDEDGWNVWNGCGNWTNTGFAELVEEEHKRFGTDIEIRADRIDYRSG